MSELTQDTIVPFLADIFARRGHEEYLGEKVTMSAHMLQGAHFAAAEGQRQEIIVAALLHDIGHFTSEFGSFTMKDTEDRLHEEAGATVLAGFFPGVVTDCVRHHVAAKRYLCAVDPAYFDDLSDASVHSLSLQGGPMREAEVAEFEKLENARDIVQVRLYDDRGKVQGLEVPGFDHYRSMVQRVVDTHLAS
jgi:phosphonate degradation associated HDIG domain protein